VLSTALEVEIHGAGDARGVLDRAARATLAALGVRDGHLAVELAGEDAIRELNHRHRGRDAATDVLSFPVDGTGPVSGPRELGDVVVCPEHAQDLEEAVVHGVLHLCGYDHEVDQGEMLAVQDRVMAALR
jgi:probable rRNA maturation factor